MQCDTMYFIIPGNCAIIYGAMKKLRTKHKIILILLVLGMICAGLFIDSNTRLVVTEYEISSERLPESFDGFTVVQLSDIHGKSFGEGNIRLLEKVEKVKPDIIAITGDMADRDTDMAVIDSLLASLTETAPVYYISGNHEWGEGLMGQLETIFERHGVIYLSNEYVLLSSGEEEIVLAGVEDPNSWATMPEPDEVVDIIKSEQGNKFTLLLGHRNYWVEKYPALEVDIIMCGHAHGGIIRLPLLGGVLGTGFELFPEHIDGVTKSGQYSMIVSRGLGNSAGIPRFLNNPEIVVLKLKSE